MGVADYCRVEAAIRYLECNFTSQPSLAEVAEHVGLSSSYFQRLFKRWAGVSPKRFLQFLTVEYAKDLLRGSETVLGATYEAGLSGAGRLHDLFVRVEAVTPGEYRSEGGGLEIRYGFHPTPFGSCLLAVTERGICRLEFPGEQERRARVEALERCWRRAVIRRDPVATAPFVDRIFGAAGVDNGEGGLEILLRGTNFQIQVWRALLLIPEGRVVSYGDIGRFIGRPAASRAVGAAVGANPIAFLIPCHRVIRRVGAFGGYRWGGARKKAMLGWEAARQQLRRGTMLFQPTRTGGRRPGPP
ncbi:MAG: bifunctional helix-turn-helix domain-containing protein/methylated-DNA--[protein]-cysteine S-methyltransferase [Acidobacteriota bacterium]